MSSHLLLESIFRHTRLSERNARKMAKSWLKIIGRLKRLIADVGPLWPDSTRLSGYAESGPYHCGDCGYLKGLKEGNVFKDENGKGRCNQTVVIADKEVKKDEMGR